MSSNVEMAPLANTREVAMSDERSNLVNERMIDDGLVGEADYPPENGFHPRVTPKPEEPEFPVNGHPEKPVSHTPLDVNLYATKKTVAQGMMDLALLTANANQLRYVLESGNTGGPYYYFSVVLISLSIVLQLIIGVALIFLGRFDMSHSRMMKKADRLNNFVVLGVFMITAINVFISAFGIDPVERIDPALIVDATLNSMREMGKMKDFGL